MDAALLSSLQAGLFIFVMRVIDMSLDTVRLLFVMRGRKLSRGRSAPSRRRCSSWR
jgi:hypothetical protein